MTAKKQVFAGMASFLILAMGTQLMAESKRFEPNWESLDQRKTPEWFSDAKFGIFIHWGVYSVPAWGTPDWYSEWYWRKTFKNDGSLEDNEWGAFHRENYGPEKLYPDFAPEFRAELYNPDEWAEIFERSGAKYIIPTSKHHDGYCIWPSEHANKTWGRPWNCVDIGPNRDLLGELVEAVRKRDIRMGFYYSLYEWFNPLYLIDPKRYVDEHMLPQFKDVVTRYEPDIIFADGEWDMPSEDWKSPEFLAWLYNESAVRDHVVVNDRWGKETRHKHGGYYTTEYGAGLPDTSHPWEETQGIGHSFGFNRNEPFDSYKSSRELILMLIDLVSRGGNFLLDIGPTADGRIPLLMQQRLFDVGDWLKVNGEAIYGTRPWKRDSQWTDGERSEQEYSHYQAKYDILATTGFQPKDGRAVKEVFFTSKPDAIYAILPGWPGDTVVLEDFHPVTVQSARLLGVQKELPIRRAGDALHIDLSAIKAGMLPCRHAYSIKIALR
jgi:alpha-L-fucosidase